MSDTLKKLIDSLETIQRSFQEPTSLVVTDTKQFLAHCRAPFDTTNIPAGTPISAMNSPILEESINTGEINKVEVGPERFGIPFIATYNPIVEDGKVIGVLITSTSTERTSRLRHIATELASTVEEMSATTEEVAHVSNVISEQIQVIANDSEFISKSVADAFNSIKLVQKIASQSRILGLNAAIEAVRAGEAGKGFTVVANEIKKLAEQSNEASSEIINFLKQINDAIVHNNHSITDIAATIEQHSKSIQELNSSFTVVASGASELISSNKYRQG